MTRSRRALALGLVAAAAYVGGAAVTGHLSLALRKPLLDGFGVIPPYRYVDPPPDAATTEAPAPGRFEVELDPQAGSLANVFSTDDNQASVALSQGAIAPSPGSTSVRLLVDPLAPEPDLVLPPGLGLVGNVVRITATYRPGGEATDLRSTAQLVLAYPAPPNAFTYAHAILQSTDGRTWKRLGGSDSIGQQLVQGDVATFGYFAVGQSATATGRRASPGGFLRAILPGLLAVGIIAVIVIAEFRIRRLRKSGSSGRGRRPKPPRRPRPPPRPTDPWEDA